MEFRFLGRTGLKVSVLGIGTWQLSGPAMVEGKAAGFPDPGRERVIDLIKGCADLGINVIDSAEMYGDGEGERRVGEAIQGTRDRWILATKFGIRGGKDGKRVVDARPVTIRRSLEGSLERLQTEYVDIFLYHTPPDSDSINEGVEILERLKQEGKIRFYGISTNDPEVLGDLVDQEAVEVVMLSHSLLTHPFRLLRLVKKHELGVMVRGALEWGLLSGKYFHGKPEFSDQDLRKQAFQRADLQKYGVYERFLPEGVPMASFALRYLMDFDSTHTIILGGKSIQDYETALRALDLPPLDRKTHKALGEMRDKLTEKSLAWRILRRTYWKARRLIGGA